MNALVSLLGIVVVALGFRDVFETIVLPRTVQRGLRLSQLLVRWSWLLLTPIVRRLKATQLRQTLLVAFAPFVVVTLVAVWAAILIVGYALIHLGHQTPWVNHAEGMEFTNYLYVSGVNFFTLGLGDVTTTDPLGRFLCVLEAGSGFGFLGLVVGYIPVFYNAFSRREALIVLLDSKAGSDASATELLRRHAQAKCMDDLVPLLKEFERWSAELLEGYLSYPILAYYRSQHDDQFWLKTITVILDTCALIELGCENDDAWSRQVRFQARATFAMARHIIVDFAYVINVAPDRLSPSRLSPERLDSIRRELCAVGLKLRTGPEADARLAAIRETYEPHVLGLSHHLVFPLPQWQLDVHSVDNWQTSAWDGMRHF